MEGAPVLALVLVVAKDTLEAVEAALKTKRAE